MKYRVTIIEVVRHLVEVNADCESEAIDFAFNHLDDESTSHDLLALDTPLVEPVVETRLPPLQIDWD